MDLLNIGKYASALIFVGTVVYALCILNDSEEETTTTTKENMAPISIKSTNRHWRYFSPYTFGMAGPAGTIAGSMDRNAINVRQQQINMELAQGGFKSKGVSPPVWRPPVAWDSLKPNAQRALNKS